MNVVEVEEEVQKAEFKFAFGCCGNCHSCRSPFLPLLLLVLLPIWLLNSVTR